MSDSLRRLRGKAAVTVVAVRFFLGLSIEA